MSTEFSSRGRCVGPQARVRRDGGDEHVSADEPSRCAATSSPCLPVNNASALEFTSARLSYVKPGARPGQRQSICDRLAYPARLLEVRGDLTSTRPASSSTLPWRADLESFPSASVPDRACGPSAGSDRPGRPARRRGLPCSPSLRSRGDEPSPSPSRSPNPSRASLTPLEQALEFLEDAVARTGRRTDVARSSWSRRCWTRRHPELARAARTLAWSEDDPGVEQTSGLATRVRDDHRPERERERPCPLGSVSIASSAGDGVDTNDVGAFGTVVTRTGIVRALLAAARSLSSSRRPRRRATRRRPSER